MRTYSWRDGLAPKLRQLGLAAVMCACLPTAVSPEATKTVPNAEKCELELVLAVDVSGSIDHYDFGLQMQGYAAAFRDDDVLRAVSALGSNGLDVTLVQWSSVGQQAQIFEWFHVSGPESAERFAVAIEQAPRSFFMAGTGIGLAVGFATKLIEERPNRCKRSVIDVSGDGRNNVGPEPAVARDFAVSSGITINGLAIRDSDLLLDVYFRKFVVGGKGAFVIAADSYIDIAGTIKKKLIRELSPHVATLPQTDRDGSNE